MSEIIQNNKKVIDEIFELVSAMRPDIISINFPHESMIPVASVCLGDVWVCIMQIHYAVNQFNKNSSTFIKHFYLEDIASRLYTATEHLAYSLQYMHDISNAEINKYRKNRSSHQITVGHYFKKEMPTLPFLEGLIKFANDANWIKTIEFRKDTIHEQAPIIENVIDKFKRTPRWVKSGGSWSLSISSNKISDEYDYKIEDVYKFISLSYVLFVNNYYEITKYYKDILTKNGISFNN